MNTNQILNWVIKHPVRDVDDRHWGGWGGWDGALLSRLGVAPEAPSIRELAKRAAALFPSRLEAPVGAVHFFLIEPYGHAVVDVCGGGRTVLEARGGGLRYTSIDEICRGGSIYLGWAFFSREAP